MENFCQTPINKPSAKTNTNADVNFSINQNQFNKISLLLKIKCDFFLIKMFDNLIKWKTLKINKYNKKIQKKLNININDYKQNSKIEIQITPKENMNGNIINITKNEKFFHIYFDDKKEEIKKYSLNENSNVKKIKIIIDPQITNLSKLFFFVSVLT